VHIHREPAGEWICLDATTTITPGGAGLATSVLSDRSGPVRSRSARSRCSSRRAPGADPPPVLILDGVSRVARRAGRWCARLVGPVQDIIVR
jgi:hypothetical protein